MHKHCKLVFGGNERGDLRCSSSSCAIPLRSASVSPLTLGMFGVLLSVVRTWCVLSLRPVRERAAEALEAILEACRVVDRGRDEREMLVAYGKERSCELEGGGMVIGRHGACRDAVEGAVGKHGGTRSSTRRRRLLLWYSPLTANTISPSTSSEFIRESMTCSSTSWRPWDRRTMRLSPSSAARASTPSRRPISNAGENAGSTNPMDERPARRERGAAPLTTSFRAPEAAPRRTTLSDDPLDDAIAVQRLQGFLGCDAADAEELRKLHLGRHAIPHAQPARPDLVQHVVVQPLVQETAGGCSRRS
jgi:hypothetical protein